SRRNNSRRRRKNKEARDVTSIPNQYFISSSDQEGEDMTANHNGEGERQARRTLAVSLTVILSLHFNNIAQPRVNATNMEIQCALIHLVQNNQFNSLSHENPYTHLSTFLEICNTMKIHQVYKVDESSIQASFLRLIFQKINSIVNKRSAFLLDMMGIDTRNLKQSDPVYANVDDILKNPIIRSPMLVNGS
ncbi:hypothetical protein V8G54_013547, partial [Vigna mungo]